MLLSLKQFVNTTNYLILANILLVFFLILLNNLGVLPITNFGNFVFFLFLLLLLALYRPGWSFLFFVGTIAIENINVAPVELGINVRPYQLFAALTIISVIVRYFAKRLNFALPKWKIWDLAPAIFAVSGFLSALFSDSVAASFKLSVIALSFAAIYYLVRIFVQDMSDIKRIAPFFISSSVIVVIYGIWQNVRFAHGLNSFEVMPGRVNGTFTEPDWYGIYLGLLIAIIYAIIYYLSNKKEGDLSSQISNQILNTKYQILNTSCWLLVTLIFISLILTVSRSAWLGAAMVSILYLVFCIWYFVAKNKSWKNFLGQLTILATAGIASIAIVYFFNLTSFQLFNRFQSTGTGLQKITVSCENCTDLNNCSWKQLPVFEPLVIKDISDLKEYHCRHINLEEIEKETNLDNFVTEVYRPDPNVNIRAEIYKKSWQEIRSNPVLGIGWGSIGDALGKDERGVTLNTSNIFLELWLGSGLIGFLSFCAIWIYVFVQAFRNILNNSEGNEGLPKTVALFIILGWMSFVTVNMFNAGIFMGILWLYLGVSRINYAHRN